MLETLLDAIPFASYAVDIQTHEVVFANKQMLTHLYAPHENPCWKKIFGQENACHWCTIPELLNRPRNGEKRIHAFFDEGSDRWFQSHDELIVWLDGRTVLYSILIDITEQKEIQATLLKTHAALAIESKKLLEANHRLEIMATTDALTGIHNRGHFFRLSALRLEQQPSKSKLLFVAMLDLDHFKGINDRFGHQTGDATLIAFCRHVHSCLDPDDLFGRIGGEEFALLLEAHDEHAVMAKLESIREGVMQIDIPDTSEKVYFTVSIGLCVYTGSETLDMLLHEADAKLYSAKKEGRNRVKFRRP